MKTLGNIQYKQNDLSTLKEVIDLSIKIFEPNEDKKKLYHDEKDWAGKLKNSGLLISAFNMDRCVGYALCYEIDKIDLHIWNVGVHTDFRKMGIWKTMYKTIEEYAKDRYSSLSLNTLKKRFPAMYNFAIKNKFQQSKRMVVQDEKYGKIIKTYFTKKLS